MTNNKKNNEKVGNETKNQNTFVKFFTKFWNRNNKLLLSIFYTLLSVAIFLSIWEVLCHFEVLKEPQIFAPSAIFERIWLLLSKAEDRELVYLTLASLSRMSISFAIALGLGIGFGLLMGWNEKISDFFDPVVTFFMSVPGIAWAPLAFIWIGFEPIFKRWGIIDDGSWWFTYGLANPILITIGIIAGIFPIIKNISKAIQATDKKLIWAARTMGASDSQIFRRVLIPNSMPYLFTGAKLGLAQCWRTIIATELMSSAAMGLGYFIFTSQEYINTLDIYAGLFTIAFIYYLVELAIKILEKLTIEKWGMVRSGGGSIE